MLLCQCSVCMMNGPELSPHGGTMLLTVHFTSKINILHLKLNRVALLIADPPGAISITRRNPATIQWHSSIQTCLFYWFWISNNQLLSLNCKKYIKKLKWFNYYNNYSAQLFQYCSFAWWNVSIWPCSTEIAWKAIFRKCAKKKVVSQVSLGVTQVSRQLLLPLTFIFLKNIWFTKSHISHDTLSQNMKVKRLTSLL